MQEEISPCLANNFIVSNIVRLGLGSLLFLFTVSCVNKTKTNTVSKRKILKDCRYYAYDAQQIVYNLGAIIVMLEIRTGY